MREPPMVLTSPTSSNFLDGQFPEKTANKRPTMKKKQNRKENGIKTKEVAFTPRVESLSYLLYTHLSNLFSSFLLFLTWRFC
jgi:hypothetical protein